MKTSITLLLLFVSSYLPLYAQQEATLFPFYKTWGQTDLCFIDKAGKVVAEVPYRYDSYTCPYQNRKNLMELKHDFFHEGYCLINAMDDKAFKQILLIYNAKGELVKEIPNMSALSNFHGGYAVIASQFEDKCYSINQKFEIQKELPYTKQYLSFNAQGFGLVGSSWLRNGDDIKYCNTQGELLSDKTFRYRDNDFANGTTKVGLERKTVFLNKKIEIIATLAENETTLYNYKAPSDGAIVLFNYDPYRSPQTAISRVIDKTGKEININPQIKASLVGYVGDGLFVKQINKGKHIFVNAEGKQMMRLPFRWSEDSQYKDGLAWVEKWEEVAIPKRIIKQLINTKTGKVLLERKVAPKKYKIDSIDSMEREMHFEDEFVFCGELIRIGFQYFTKQGEVAFTLPANSVLIKQMQDYKLYAPEAIQYFEPDPYDVTSEQYVSLQQFKGIERVNPVYICLSKWQMKSIPKEIFKMSNLKKVDLTYMGLTEIPDEISKLIKLEELQLRHNDIKILPEAINTIPNLTTINLFYNPYQGNISRYGILWHTEKPTQSHVSSSSDFGVAEVAQDSREHPKEEVERPQKIEVAYRLPKELPVLSDRGAKLILTALKATETDTLRIIREYNEMQELSEELSYEEQGQRRDDRLMYSLSTKRRKEIYKILKEKELQEIESRKVNPSRQTILSPSYIVFDGYLEEKRLNFRIMGRQKDFMQKFNNIDTLKKQLASEQHIKGFNLVKMVEEQVQQKLPENAIKQNIRTYLDKEFTILIKGL